MDDAYRHIPCPCQQSMAVHAGQDLQSFLHFLACRGAEQFRDRPSLVLKPLFLHQS